MFAGGRDMDHTKYMHKDDTHDRTADAFPASTHRVAPYRIGGSECSVGPHEAGRGGTVSGVASEARPDAAAVCIELLLA